MFGGIFYDIINAIYAAGIVFILFYIYKVPFFYYIVLIGHLALVFLTNDFLFPASYMPDQFRYLHSSYNIRESLNFLHYYQFDRAGFGNTSNASLIFALFPLPFLNYVYSIAIINFILYSIIFIFLYRKQILKGKNIWFYLLFPSFALYSAIGTRDILILFIMILGIYYFYKEKLWKSIIISSLLVFIKAQNFLIFVFSILVYKAIAGKKLLSLKNFFWLGVASIFFVIFIIKFSGIELIDYYRMAMYVEDGGDPLKYKHISTISDLFIEGLTGSIYMILKPLPWESSNALQLIQSIENFVIFFIIGRLFVKTFKIKNKFITFLNIYFFMAMAIYGIVVFNFGTASRYRFTFELIYIIFILYILEQEKFKGSKK